MAPHIGLRSLIVGPTGGQKPPALQTLWTFRHRLPVFGPAMFTTLVGERYRICNRVARHRIVRTSQITNIVLH